MFKKLILLTIIIAGIAVAFLMLSKNRPELFPEGEKNSTSQQEDTRKNEAGGSDTTGEKEDSPGDSSENVESLEPVSLDDCQAECSNYDTENYRKACFEECNITNVSKDIKDCSKMAGAEKDLCWKEKAVREKNLALCDNITDAVQKKSCQDRLTEEFLENL